MPARPGGFGVPTKLTLRGLLLLAVVPGAALLTVPASAGAVPGALLQGPLQRGATQQSINWAGFDATHGPYKSVSGSWVQPGATCGSQTTYAAFWVGLDGGKNGDNTVEQTGTIEQCSGGRAAFGAWYEMYPAGLVVYNEHVSPGDHFSASVTSSGSSFTMTITDSTEGWSKTTTKSSSSATKGTAEAMAEAPASGSEILPLTDFGSVSFKSVKVDGSVIGSTSPLKLNMVTESGALKAKTSSLTDGENFKVTWKHT
jgi:Peptidase A4 family